MATSHTYYYENGKMVKQRTSRGNSESVIRFDTVLNNVSEVRGYYLDELTEVFTYFYNNYGLLDHVVWFMFDDNVGRKYLEYKFVYIKN